MDSFAKYNTYIIILFLLAIFSSSLVRAEIYKTVDENGKVIFTDKNPDAVGAKEPQQKSPFGPGYFEKKYEEIKRAGPVEKEAPPASQETPAIEVPKAPPSEQLVNMDFIHYSKKVPDAKLEQIRQHSNQFVEYYYDIFNVRKGEFSAQKIININVHLLTYNEYVERWDTIYKKRQSYQEVQELYINLDCCKTAEAAYATILRRAYLLYFSGIVYMNIDEPWFREGWISYFSDVDLDQQEMVVKKNPRKLALLHKYLDNGSIDPSNMDAFMTSGRYIWETSDFRVRDDNWMSIYSWALVAFLHKDEASQEFFLKIEQGFYNHPGRLADSGDTIEENYPGGVEAFQKDWRQWVEAEIMLAKTF